MPRLSRLVLNSIFRMGYTARYTTAVLKPYTSARGSSFFCSVSGAGSSSYRGTRRLSRQASTREGRQHHRILAAGGKHHQRGQTHALHDHRVIQEHPVMVGKFAGVFYDQFSRCASHCAAPFPASACRWVR